MISIYGMIYDELDAKRKHAPEDFKPYAKAFDALDREALAGIVMDRNVFWFEYSQFGDISNTAIEQLIKYIERKGYKYLYRMDEVTR